MRLTRKQRTREKRKRTFAIAHTTRSRARRGHTGWYSTFMTKTALFSTAGSTTGSGSASTSDIDAKRASHCEVRGGGA